MKVKRGPTYIATVQIVLAPDCASTVNEAMDIISGMMENCDRHVLDWSYLRVGGQRLYPNITYLPMRYKEGDFEDIRGEAAWNEEE